MVAPNKDTIAQDELPTPPLQLLATPPEDQEQEGGDDSAEANGGHVRRKHWSLDEMRLVATELAGMVRKQGWRKLPEIGDRGGRRMLAEMLAAAQIHTLPRERRRLGYSLQAFNMVFWKMVEDALTNKADLAAQALVAEVAKEVGIPPEQPPAAPVPPDGYAILPEKDPLGSVPLDVLLRTAFARLVASANKVDELEGMHVLLLEELEKTRNLHEVTLQRLAVIENAIKNTPKQEVVQLPRVAIIGCERYEFTKIVTTCRDLGLRLDLKHHEADDSRGIFGEWAILLPWANHSWREKAKATLPNGKWICIDGGARKAVEQLLKWFQTS